MLCDLHIAYIDFRQLLHSILDKVCGHAENTRVREKSETTAVEDVEYADDFGEGI